MGLRNSIFAAIQAPFATRGSKANPDSVGVDYAVSNGFTFKARNAADTADVPMIGVDSDNVLQLGGEAIQPQQKVITYDVAANGSLGTTVILNVDRAYTITGITEIHKTAGSDAGAVTAYVEKLSGATAPGSGTSVMTSTFNMKATANTLQTAALATTNKKPNGASGTLDVAAGDRIAVVFSGTLTALAGVVISITMTPAAKGHTTAFFAKANADLAGSQVFFTALRPTIVTGVKMSWATPGTDAGTVTIDLTKDVSTNAPGAGTSILTAAVSAKTAANTVGSPALTAASTVLIMQPGDRLAYKPTGTLTALAGVCITVSFAPAYGFKKLDFAIPPSGVAVDQVLWTADRDYIVELISCVWATASTSNKTLITRDSGTTAPGAGVALHTDNTSAGFDTSTTANTVAFATLAAIQLRYITAGDRISIKNSGTTGALAGVAISLGLLPR